MAESENSGYCLKEKDHEKLLAFYDCPTEHRQSIRTTNPIESTFATIRHRIDKGMPESRRHAERDFKLGMTVEGRWRRLNGFRKLGKVIEGIKLRDGIKVVVQSAAENEDSRIAA